MQIDLKEIKDKKLYLEQIKSELKTELFGLDSVIDRVVDSVKTWYLIPNLITYPIIINLFGLTGTGKTQLVRSLVKKLGFQNKFVEIQMDGTSGGSNYSSSICQILQSSSINEGDTGVILLDEFQRFRTKDLQGQDVKIERYQDVWQLLSDGKFAIDSSIFSSLETELASAVYCKDVESEDFEEKEEAEKKKRRRFKISPWEANGIKKLMKLKESIQEIMTWDIEKVMDLKKEFIKTNVIDFIDYSKCIIFVCGNLDEVFSVSGDVENSDTDADVFYSLTKMITVGNVKESLTKRFKPEQISRLGNNIIIYPSLPKSAYTDIIIKTCNTYISKAKESSGVDFMIDDSVYQTIYDNSVYPAQGTRPVFSSIHKIFGSPLSDIVLWALENKINEATISLDPDKSVLLCKKDKTLLEIPVDLELFQQKKRNSLDFLSMVAVHEAGHAVVYALLFNRCPQEISINLASYKGGYIIRQIDNAYQNKQELLNNICVNLAGLCAEEIVFGKEFRSSGCQSDIMNATTSAGRFVRQLAFSDTISFIGESASNLYFEQEYEESNKIIEKILNECKEKIFNILTENKQFFIESFQAVLDKKKILEKEYIELVRKFIPDIKTGEWDTSVSYNELVKEFSERK